MLALLLSLLALLVVAVLLYAQPDGTRVTWSMQGPAAYMTKLMGVFFDMDRMIGRDFETGLAALKALSEK